MSRQQQEWAVMAVVAALLTIATGERSIALIAALALGAMLVYGWRERR